MKPLWKPWAGPQTKEGVLTEDNPTTVRFTNRFWDRNFDMTVTNTVQKEYSNDTLPADTSFSYTLVLTPDSATKNIDRAYSYVITHADGTVTEENGVVTTAEATETVTFTLADTETIEFTDLPVGSYTVTESNAKEADYSTTVNGADSFVFSGSIAPATNQEVTVDFVNTYKRHLFELTVAANCSNSEQNFAFTVTGAATGITLDIVLVGTDSIIIRDLPADTYTVTPLNGWAWRMNGTAENNGTVVLSEDRTVTYNWTKVAELIYWLNGYAYRRECKG